MGYLEQISGRNSIAGGKCKLLFLRISNHYYILAICKNKTYDTVEASESGCLKVNFFYFP